MIAGALACFAPAVFLSFYAHQFDYSPLIILLGQAAVLLAVASIDLAALGIGIFRPPRRTKTCARFIAIAMGLLDAALVVIFAGAYFSNAVWGDTLNYDIASTLLSHIGTAVACC